MIQDRMRLCGTVTRADDELVYELSLCGSQSEGDGHGSARVLRIRRVVSLAAPIYALTVARACLLDEEGGAMASGVLRFDVRGAIGALAQRFAAPWGQLVHPRGRCNLSDSTDEA